MSGCTDISNGEGPRNTRYFHRILTGNPLICHRDWRDTYIRVSSIEGMSSAIAWNVTRAPGTPPGPDSQFTKGSRFYALAALELLDSPGEYHINSTTGELWLLPVRSLAAASELVVSVLDTVIDAKVAHHSFVDLQISDARGQLLVMTGANNLVQNCTITNSGGACAAAAGANNSLRNNTIYGCGMAGVSLFAGMPTGALVAGNASVIGCRITNVSRIARTCECARRYNSIIVDLRFRVATHH